jgi:hypothetical protein
MSLGANPVADPEKASPSVFAKSRCGVRVENPRQAAAGRNAAFQSLSEIERIGGAGKGPVTSLDMVTKQT